MVDKVASHYAGGGDLASAIAESLRKAGKDIGKLTRQRSRRRTGSTAGGHDIELRHGRRTASQCLRGPGR